MRTTLTLDDDVAKRLERRIKQGDQTFKAVVNEALRAGLEALEAPRAARKRFRTRGFDLGDSRVGSLDNVEEVLSRVEGDDHR